MASTATIFSVMLLLSLFTSSAVLSAARQLTDTPKVNGDQTANPENLKDESGSTKVAKNATTLGDKKFFLPIPIPIPIPILIPISRNLIPKLPKTPTLPGPAELPTPGPAELPTPAPAELPTPGAAELPTPGAAELPTPAPAEHPTPGPPELPTPGAAQLPTPGPAELPTPGAAGDLPTLAPGPGT